MLNENQQHHYLKAMQIDCWLPRTPLPYAKQYKESTLAYINSPTERSVSDSIENQTILPPTILEKNDLEEDVLLANNTQDNTPSFSLQLMHVGNCLLLIELPTTNAFQAKDPVYQLLRNILFAAKLPVSPQPLGEPIQWPLFKQSSIAQGKKEAQEFLQSFIITYKEQFIDTRCLWLIGLSSIRYAIDFNETNYFESPIIEPYGQTLLSPSLDTLIKSPSSKASLWQSLRKLIPLWQN